MPNPSQHRRNQLVEPKPVNHLTVRLRRMVRAVLVEKERGNCCEIEFLVDKRHPVFLKGVWVFACVLCLSVFLYQTYDRISFYFTYPVTTDVLISKKPYQTLPEITICYQESDRMFQIYDPFSTDGKCSPIPVSSLLKNLSKIPVEEVWERINTTAQIIAANEINPNKEDLHYTSVPLIYGTCTTFRSKTNRPFLTDSGRMEIHFKIFTNHSCSQKSKSPVYVHDVDEFPLSSKLHIHAVGGRNEVAITVKQINDKFQSSACYNFEKKVNFLNRTRNVCVSTIDYRNCIEDCFNKYTTANGDCRFPFHSEQLNLKPCIFSNYTYDLWKKMQLYLTGDTETQNCTCPRKCNHRIFYIKATRTVSHSRHAEHVLYFDDPHETVIQERLIYDTIKLLSDIGGNSCLFIGVSLLSIFKITHRAVISPVKKGANFTSTDPLYLKVCKVYKKFQRNTIDKKTPPAKTLSDRSILELVVLMFGIGLFLFAIANRASHYLQYPTRNLVRVSFNATLYSPSVVICPGDPNVMGLQRQYALKHNIENSCDVKMWDLLDLPGITATDVWINKEIAVGKNFWRSYQLAYLPDGTCVDLDDGRNPIPASRISWITSNMSSLCGTNYQKVYIRPPTKDYEYFLYRYIVQQHVHQIMFTVKEIQIERKFIECVLEMEHETCKQRCLMKKLWSRIHCRLPYMPPSSLPLCSTSLSGRHSHLTYLKLFALPDSAQQCDCAPPCVKRFYEIRVSTEEQNWLSFSFGSAHKVIETYSQEHSYSIVQLLGDIGGWLGTTLGLCLLTAVERLLTAGSFLLLRRLRARRW